MVASSKGKVVANDLVAGLVVFLVALPLCLGIALGSNAPLFSGLVTGIVGGIVVGILSGSQTSVSGPAAGLTAVVSFQIAQLGFDAFLVAVVVAGLFQIVLSLFQMGFIAAFFPTSVIKGLLAAIGIILILKQIPHVLGHDPDPMGSESFFQPDNKNTFTEIIDLLHHIEIAPALIGICSLILMVLWEKVEILKKTRIPSILMVVLFGIGAHLFLRQFGAFWSIEKSHLVQVPLASTMGEFFGFFKLPDFSVLSNPALYVSAVTIALVASLETLLNIEAVDKIDPLKRFSPPNRELMAQGVGNIVAGMLGGLPMTSVIVRSSVNLNAGVKTKISAIFHGILLLVSVMFVPNLLNLIPLSALAAILLITGYKLSSLTIIKGMWREGWNQFLPFITTVVAIVLTDILTGVLIGLGVAISFILHSYIRRPMNKYIEKHYNEDEVLRIELPNQVSFLNKAALETTLRSVKKGGHVLIDASATSYIDPDILFLIRDFEKNIARINTISVSLEGFKDKYPQLEDKIRYVDFASREMQSALTPEQVLEIFRKGNERFRKGTRLRRDVGRLLDATRDGQYPMAVVLSCIDSRTPVELIFDLGLGDIFSVRIAGNTVSEKVLGSIEFSCAVAGAKMILVMGHTSCGAVKAAVDLHTKKISAEEATGCAHLGSLLEEIQHSIKEGEEPDLERVSHRNILRTMQIIRSQSPILRKMLEEGKIAMVGSIYDISTGEATFFNGIKS